MGISSNICLARTLSTSDSWYTPKWILERLGKFDLDPCGSREWKTAQKIIELPQDGLSTPWKGRVWLNPPFGRAAKNWVKKLSEHGSGIALLAARTDAEWFHDFVFDRARGLLFLRKRIQFLNASLELIKTGALPIGVVLIAYSGEDSGVLKNCGLSGKFWQIK